MTAGAMVIHGHMYQPPRADPRTGLVPVEPTAAPYHDWNQRITDECYRPNAFARIFDERGRIVRIVNNFEKLSFNLGPTLGRWLDEHAPDVARRVAEGDAIGGTAIAQPFHHLILPLAGRRDARTELLWGLADFERRFGRTPRGVWLPETGVDTTTLRLLAELDIDFTILAPGQVVHPPPAGSFGIAEGVRLVVYDGPLSHDIAFGDAMLDTAALVDHLTRGVDGGTVTVATDLETFGHHHRGTERGVAHALFVVAPSRGVATGPLSELVAASTPVDVGGVRTSAWSCAHGLGRWQDDCGCSTDGRDGWNQQWRTPLRQALDLLHKAAEETFGRLGRDVFHDSWEARDDYGVVIADPGRWGDFVTQQVKPLASEELASILLRSQEASLASFTSCAWFFADLARREIAIVMQEANRAAELLRSIDAFQPVDRALEILDGAFSNDPDLPTGRDVWAWALSDPPPSATGAKAASDDPLGALLDRLVGAAIGGDGSASDQAQALVALIADRDHGSRTINVDTAQNALWAAREHHSRSDLDPLAAALGFAVD